MLVPLPMEGSELRFGEVTDGPTIERLFLDRNERHFSQAGNTPLESNEVIEKLGFGGTTLLATRNIGRHRRRRIYQR